MTENEIAAMVVDASLCVHRTLGPGLFESVYQAALNYELKNRGLVVFQQLGLPVQYELSSTWVFESISWSARKLLSRSNQSKLWRPFTENKF
jgi:PD-(D/E)XK nuclease superfamily protein